VSARRAAYTAQHISLSTRDRPHDAHLHASECGRIRKRESEGRRALTVDIGSFFSTASPDSLGSRAPHHGEAEPIAAFSFSSKRFFRTYRPSIPRAAQRRWRRRICADWRLPIPGRITYVSGARFKRVRCVQGMSLFLAICRKDLPRTSPLVSPVVQDRTPEAPTPGQPERSMLPARP